MSSDLERFFELRAEYNSANVLVKSVWLDKRFDALEKEVQSPSVKAAIRKFITEEKAAARKRSEEYMAEYRRKRDAQIDKGLALLNQWSLGSIPLSTARGLIRAATWWLTHSSGHPVRAPGHDYRLQRLDWGWSIEFGANHFLVGRALQRSAPILMEGFNLLRDNKFPNEKYFVQHVKAVIPTCVANYNADLYEKYATTRGRLIFGAQAVDVSEAANYIIRASGLGNHFFNLPAQKKEPGKPQGS